MKQVLAAIILVATAGCAHAGTPHTQVFSAGGNHWDLQVPADMRLELLNDTLEGPRMIMFMPNGDLLAGSRSGNVYRLPPPYNEATVLVHLDDYPHALAWRVNELLIAQTDGLYRAPYRPGQARIDADDVELYMELPGGGGHNSRTVGIGPDGRVYVSLGISGNCSDEYLDDRYDFIDRRGGVLVLDENGAKPRWRTYASGLRNPVGFAWHPQTGKMYATNNGPDHLGYNQPPEYFSELSEDSFHGMPWFQYNGTRVQRDHCIGGRPPRPLSEVRVPVATFPARNAPMGVAFVPDDALGGRYSGNAIVALKGSWGTRPSGGWGGDPATRRHPGLVMVEFDDGKPGAVRTLVSGFQLPNGNRLARPVGVAFGPDGALYFTSDSNLQGLFRLRLAE